MNEPPGARARVAPWHVLTFFVTEVFSDGKSRKGHSSTSTWRFIHLTVHQRDLRSFGRSSGFIDFDNTGLNHFVVKIIPFSGTLSNTSEDLEVHSFDRTPT